MRFRRSRYHYWWQYSIIIFAALAWMYLRDSGRDGAAFICGIIAAFGFIALELLIQVHTVNITKDGVDVHKPFRQSSFTSFAQLQDIASIDSRVSRALRYGDVRLFTQEKQKLIQGVHEARKLVNVVKRKQ